MLPLSRRFHLVSSVLLGTAAISGAGMMTGCGSSSSTPNTPTTNTIAVSPTDSKLLTCNSLAFTETGGVGNGTWSVTPNTSGTITSSGLYSAPKSVPASPDATITYAEAAGSASGVVHLATAFLGSEFDLTLPAQSLADQGNVPFEHAFSANGTTRVYGAFAGPSVIEGGYATDIDIFSSNDNGHTFGAPTVYKTAGKLQCGTVAIDAVNSDVVYLAYYSGHADSGTNTGATVRLAVSEDGGKTFPKEYVVADSTDSMVDFICPDVSSPSGDHVIVSGGATDNTNGWAATFVSSNRGANIGPVGTVGKPGVPNPSDTTSTYSSADTNVGTKTNCSVDADGNGQGPRVLTNGKGTACLAYKFIGDCGLKDGYISQCSSDNGATWTAPKAIVTNPPSGNRNYFTGAVSPSGKVAYTWIESVGSDDEVKIVISKDGGKTFGTPFVYPSASRVATQLGYSGLPVITWESDDILWMSETLASSDFPAILVDKTCDDGLTWSGAVIASKNQGTSLVRTQEGMLLTGRNTGAASKVFSLPLAQLK